MQSGLAQRRCGKFADISFALGDSWSRDVALADLDGDLGPPERFFGLTMEEARDFLVGYELYLPTIQGPERLPTAVG